MRKFNLLEKEIIEKLVNSPALNEQGLILCSKFLEDNYIGERFDMSLAVECIEKKVLMLLPKKENFEELQRAKIIFVITFFNLIKDLQNERQIYLIGDNDKEGLLGPQFSEKISFAKDLDEIICDSFFKLIAVSQDLVEYVKNDFKTDEEIRHNETLRISKIGIGVAIIIGLSSIILCIYSDKISDNTVKLDTKQFNTLIKYQDSIGNNMINFLDTTRIEKDTTKHRH
ncbi:MAG: hypothetical protein JXB49_34920 [Bacteroidales bacterium]|nr:hypothetical protein [Bacteroidales bacterium]MBN2817869.1 hypothetical protein [Bacteroidales bacterium]